MDLSQIALMFVLRMLLCAGVSWLLWRFVGWQTAVFSVVLWGLLLAKPLLELIAAWFNWAKREPYAKWQGNYYEFANVQIRILARNDGLWFCAADVLHVIGEKPVRGMENIYGAADYQRFADERIAAFSEQGVERVLRASRHRDAARMWLWLEREVIKQHYRKLEIAELDRKNALSN
jgi:hypothetical protein